MKKSQTLNILKQQENAGRQSVIVYHQSRQQDMHMLFLLKDVKLLQQLEIATVIFLITQSNRIHL